MKISTELRHSIILALFTLWIIIRGLDAMSVEVPSRKNNTQSETVNFTTEKKYAQSETLVQSPTDRAFNQHVPNEEVSFNRSVGTLVLTPFEMDKEKMNHIDNSYYMHAMYGY